MSEYTWNCTYHLRSPELLKMHEVGSDIPMKQCEQCNRPCALASRQDARLSNRHRRSEGSRLSYDSSRGGLLIRVSASMFLSAELQLDRRAYLHSLLACILCNAGASTTFSPVAVLYYRISESHLKLFSCWTKVRVEGGSGQWAASETQRAPESIVRRASFF